VWAISRGEVPSPSTPSMSDSRLSWPHTPAGVPVMFRRSSGSSPISKRSIEQLRCSERCTPRGEHTFDPSHGGSQGFKSPHLHPHNPQVRASPASSRRRSPHSGAALGPRTPIEGCSTSAWERLPKLVNRQSNPSTINNSVCCREQAGAPVVQDLPGGRCHWLLSCWTCRPAGTATGPVGPAIWRGTALYGNGPRARYCLGLEIYRNEPIPASGGPA
jgi:hypothetical protein